MKIHSNLHLFNHIVAQGIKHDGKYSLNGMNAWHDLDGYTCYISYKDLTMGLYFHNRYSYDFKEQETLLQFEALAEKLLSNS